MLVGHSEVLGLELRLTPGAPVRDVLRFYDPMLGEPLRSLREAERRLDEEAQAREAAEVRLRQTQDRLRELEAELRSLRNHGR